MKKWQRKAIIRPALAGLMMIAIPGACAYAEPPQANVEHGRVQMKSAQVTPGRELMTLAQSQEEAEEIAALYEIELVSFSDGVAVFHTDKDPEEVIRRGEEEDLPRLSVNRNSYRQHE